MSDDHSPGDARKPYSDIGGPQARHAQTHDVRREQVTNPKGPQPEDTSFADQMAQETTGDHGGHQGESVTAVDEKALHELLPDLDRDQLTRLSVLAPARAGWRLPRPEQPSRWAVQGDRGAQDDQQGPDYRQARYRF
jgi:hypothetical protein